MKNLITTLAISALIALPLAASASPVTGIYLSLIHISEPTRPY